jgi:hypothetical protein
MTSTPESTPVSTSVTTRSGDEVQDVVPASPDTLRAFTNEELRQESYVVAQVLDVRMKQSIGEQIGIAGDRSANESSKAQRTLSNESNLSKMFREKYLAYCVLLQEEIRNRLGEKPPYMATMLDDAAKQQGFISGGQISNIADGLRGMARRLR